MSRPGAPRRRKSAQIDVGGRRGGRPSDTSSSDRHASKPSRVVVFGAGVGGLRLWAALAAIDGIDVVSFLDNDPRKQGTTLAGLPVLGPSTLASLDYARVLIASVHHADIRAQLIAHGVPRRRLVVLSAGGAVREQLRAAGLRIDEPIAVPPSPAARVAIFGAGVGGLRVWQALAGCDVVDIVAFIDSDERRRRTAFLGIPVIAPEALDVSSVDAVVLGSVHAESIVATLCALGVPSSRVYTVRSLLAAAESAA